MRWLRFQYGKQMCIRDRDEANIMDIIFDTKGSSVKKIFMAVDQGAFSAVSYTHLDVYKRQATY